jgi:proline racemase
VSARAAVHPARGEPAPGQTLAIESIIGTAFSSAESRRSAQPDFHHRHGGLKGILLFFRHR